MTNLRPVFIDENGYTADKSHRLITLCAFDSYNPPCESVFASAEPVGFIYQSSKAMQDGSVEDGPVDFVAVQDFRTSDGDYRAVYLHPPAPRDLTGLMHELWAIAQSPGPVSETVGLMMKAYEDNTR